MALHLPIITPITIPTIAPLGSPVFVGVGGGDGPVWKYNTLLI